MNNIGSNCITIEQPIGVSRESEITLKEMLDSLKDYYFMPISRRSATEEFYSLVSEWRKDVKHLSSITEMAMHPAYQQIIGMGKNVLPLIFSELETRPNHWFWALKAITGEDPIQPNQRGNIPQMTQTWLNWAKDNNINW